MCYLHMRQLTSVGVFWSVWLDGSETCWTESRNLHQQNMCSLMSLQLDNRPSHYLYRCDQTSTFKGANHMTKFGWYALAHFKCRKTSFSECRQPLCTGCKRVFSIPNQVAEGLQGQGGPCPTTPKKNIFFICEIIKIFFIFN